jgi:hypothetical protein
MSVSVDRSPDGGETGSIPVRETPGSTPGTDTYSDIAQLVEQRTVNPWVVGSSPTVGAFLLIRRN